MNASPVFGEITKSFNDIVGLPLRDLLPLIPPDAVLGQTSIGHNQLGKIPGKYAGGKWYGMKNWALGLTERDQTNAADCPTQNIGLRAVDFPAVDIDVNSKEALKLVEGLIVTCLGRAPIRERGNAPRALHMFRRVGDTAIRKMKLQFEDDQNITHAVEVLGDGQQYVINGLHPSGAPYVWRKGHELMSATTQSLTGVTADKMTDFMAVLETKILDRGWKITSSIKPRYGSGSEGVGFAVNEIEPLVSKELALAALNALKNDADQFPTREKLLSLTASFKHALGKNADSAYPEWEEWATREGWADTDYAHKVWVSLPSVRTSPDLLFGLARRRGFRGDAAVDFAGLEMGSEASKKADTQVAEATLQEREARERLQEIADKLVYAPSEKAWIVRGTGVALDNHALNYHSLGKAIAPAGTAGAKSASAVLANSNLVKEVSGVTYLPGQPDVVKWVRNGHSGDFYNQWHAFPHALPVSVTDDDVAQWLKHVELVISDESEREAFLDYLGYVVQNRGKKVRYAPIIIGQQGTGKDLMLRPLSWWFGHNCAEVSPEKLQSQFNDFVERELIIVQEMVRFDKVEAYNHLKVMISGSGNDTLTVEKKFKNPYTVPNTVNMIFFSNHIDAVKLEEDDRRFFVIHSDMQPQTSEYYDALADRFYKQGSGCHKVIRWLMQRDISAFRPDARPMETEGKRQMIEAQRPDFQQTIVTQLNSGVHKDRTIFTAKELYDTVTTDYNYPMDQRVRGKVANAARVADALKAACWSQTGQVRVFGSNAAPVRLWVRDKKMLELDPRTLREKYKAQLSDKSKAASDFM